MHGCLGSCLYTGIRQKKFILAKQECEETILVLVHSVISTVAPIQLSVLSHSYNSQFNHTHTTLSTITPIPLSVQSLTTLSTITPIPLSVQSHPYNSQYNHTHTALSTITPIQLSVQSHPYNSQYNHTHATQYNHTHTTLSTITPIQLSELSHPYLSIVTLIQLSVQSPYNSQYCHTHTVLLCASMPELKRVRCDGHPIKSNPERIRHFKIKLSAYRMVCGCGPMGTSCFFFSLLMICTGCIKQKQNSYISEDNVGK